MTENLSSKTISLIDLYFEPEEWSFGISVNYWVFIVIACLSAAILVWRWKMGKFFPEKFEIDQAEIGVGDQKITLKPNYTDKQVAYAIWVELSTRKIGLEIDFDHDVIAEVYDSWYTYFSVTRDLIKGISVSQIQNTSTRAIINLSVDVLNEGLRPHLTHWQARFRRWYERELKRYEEDPSSTEAIDLQEVQKRFPKYEELKKDMERVNARLIVYRKKMQQLVFR